MQQSSFNLIKRIVIPSMNGFVVALCVTSLTFGQSRVPPGQSPNSADFSTQVSNSKAILKGQITDPNGAAISRLRLELYQIVNKKRGNERRVLVLNKEATFIFEDLVPGDYELEASSLGFRNLIVTNISIANDSQTPLDLSMDVGLICTVAVENRGVRPIVDASSSSITTKVFLRKIN